MNNLKDFILGRAPHLRIEKAATGERGAVIRKLAEYLEFIEQHTPETPGDERNMWIECQKTVADELDLLEGRKTVSKAATASKQSLGTALTDEAFKSLPRSEQERIYQEAISKADIGRVGGRDGSQHTGVRKKS